MTMSLRAELGCVLCLIACERAPGASVPQASTAALDERGSAGARAAEVGTAPRVWSAAIAVAQVPAGSEDHVCSVIELDNPTPVWVNALETRLSSGAHHVIVDRPSGEGAAWSAPMRCDPSGGNDATRLTIGQQPHGRMQLPAGVAHRLEVRQRVFLQLHYVNAGALPQDIRADVELVEASGDVSWTEAHSMFTGTLEIELLPRQPGIALFETGVVAGPPGTVRHVFALTSHMHHLGVRASIVRHDAAAGLATLVHESLDWSEPPLSVFEPALTLLPTETLQLTCEYSNTTDRVVRFGPNADAEMCMIWIHFYDR